MKNKYPVSLFITGFVLNLFVRFFFLFFSAVILLIVGIWIKNCRIIGLILLTLDMIFSFVAQLRIRKVTLCSKDPDFTEFQDAVLSEDWRENIQTMLEDKMNVDQDLGGIEKDIREQLFSDDRNIALDFVHYLKDHQMNFIRENGCWKDKIYYVVKFKEKCVCFVAIKDPDERENRWTVWFGDQDSDWSEACELKEQEKEIAWKHVDFCGACGSCDGGKRKTIFGKEFENVCDCTFRFDNPEIKELAVMKKIAEVIQSGSTDQEETRYGE